MLRCNEVTKLYATDELHGASLRKRVAVRIHVMMCRSCQRYVQELSAIGDAVRRVARDAPEDPERLDVLVRRILPEDDGPQPEGTESHGQER